MELDNTIRITVRKSDWDASDTMEGFKGQASDTLKEYMKKVRARSLHDRECCNCKEQVVYDPKSGPVDMPMLCTVCLLDFIRRDAIEEIETLLEKSNAGED